MREPDLKARAEIITTFIKIAAECKGLQVPSQYSVLTREELQFYDFCCVWLVFLFCGTNEEDMGADSQRNHSTI